MPANRPLSSALLQKICWLVPAIAIALTGEIAFGAEPSVSVTVERAGEAFVVDATIEVPVALSTAWDVMTDFDHMTSILDNLKSSKVTTRTGNTWIVRQEGVAHYGLLSFAFESEREMRLEPMQRILGRHLSGTASRMESEARLISVDQGVQIRYHAESVVASMLGRMFGVSFLRHEVEEQWLAMTREMLRRQANVRTAENVSR